jgi:Ca2+-binding EF-hand superfamily protein
MSVSGIPSQSHALAHRHAQANDPTTVAQQRIAGLLDDDGDGAVDAAELSALDKGEHGKNGRPAQALFAALTGLSDGKVVLPETAPGGRFAPRTLSALIDTQAEASGSADGTLADKIMAKLDKDGDGAFTLDELKDALPGKSGHAHGRGRHAERAFARLDGDGDGKVTGAELSQALGLLAAAPPAPEDPPAAPVETAAAGDPPAPAPEVVDPTLQQP